MEHVRIIEAALEGMFRRVLQESTGEPPQLSEVRIGLDDANDGARISARFESEAGPPKTNYIFISRIGLSDAFRARLTSRGVLYEAGALWSRCYEDHYIGRVLRAGQEELHRAYETGGMALVQARRNAFTQFEEQARRNHRFLLRDAPSPHEADQRVAVMPEINYAVTTDLIDSADVQITTTTRREMHERTAARLTQEMETRLLDALHMGAQSSNAEPGEESTFSIETLRDAVRALGRNPYAENWRRAFREPEIGVGDGSYEVVLGGYRFLMAGAPGGDLDVGTKAAQQRGIALLKDHLTEAQLQQYEKHRYFDVKGGSSGTTYRIHHGRQMNIEELTYGGSRACGWCFLPQGGLVAGDVMLAQKNALELYETEALKIANRLA